MTLTSPNVKRKTCELCGVEFVCGASENPESSSETSGEPSGATSIQEPPIACWCFELPILTDKIVGASDCVCRVCLSAQIAKS